MRSPSITLLSLAALSASLAEGAALPLSSGSPSSSRRSSIASTTSVSSPTSSTSSASTSTSTTVSSSSSKPLFKTDVFTSSTSASTSSKSTSTSVAPTTTTKAATRAGFPPIAVNPTTSSSTSAAARAGFPLQKTTSSISTSSTTMRRSSSLLNPTVTTTSSVRKSSTAMARSTSTNAAMGNAAGNFAAIAAAVSSTSSVPVKATSSLKPASSAAAAMPSNLVFGQPMVGAIAESSASAAATAASPTTSSKASVLFTTSKASSSILSSSKPATTTSAAQTTSSSAIKSAAPSSAPASSTQKPVATSSVPKSQTPSSSSSALPSASTKATSTSVAQSSTIATASTIKTTSTTSTSTTASAAATVSVAPISLGCWYDTSDDRSMTGPSYVDSNNMTTESCASFCTAHGMPFSGTEYGEECYCSTTAPDNGSADWCNMPCTGNDNEICGSGNALSVLYTPSNVLAATTSTNLGCYADSADLRTMTGPSFTSSSMTNEACVTFCTVEGYQYSGTEYGSQCYCSNTAPWSAPVGCSMACAGDSSEICGDGNALSVTLTQNATSTTSSAAAATTTATAKKALPSVDLNAKFQSWSTWKARGVNLGNWLVLEQWMYPTWFDNTAPGAVDEWTLCQSLGTAACTTALQQHWSTFMTEDDINTMAIMNVNTLRIPVGFWAFVDPIAGEPYIRSTQLAELTRVLGYASNHGMTVIVDIHGLPGSQNGKDHSGHLGSIEWYTAENQARSLAVVQAAATWIANSGYAGSVISSLEVANEPAIADWATWLQYKDYVLASHKIIQATVPSVATMFHDGFWPLEPWNNFFSSSDNAVIDTHKYWAFSATTIEQATSDVCAYVDEFAVMNIPVFIGEFSLSVSADVTSFVSYAVAFFESQMSVWLQAAGAAFWSVKVIQDNGEQNPAWSAEGIYESGIFNGTDVWKFTESAC